MPKGFYGGNKGATVTQSDIEIYYCKKNYEGENKSYYVKIENNDIVTPIVGPSGKIDGFYDLNLPTDIFSEVGHYDILVTPKKTTYEILDIGLLAGESDTSGVVLKVDSGSLDYTGYAININDITKYIVTGSMYVTPVNQSVNSSNQKSIRYSVNTSQSNGAGTVFLTVAPSELNAIKAGDIVDLVNTSFEPILIGLDIVKNDFDTISWLIGGTQVRSIEDGIITTYDENNNIYKQDDIYTLKDSLNNPVYEVRENRELIDITKTYDTWQD